MNQLIKGPVRKVQMCALLVFVLALLVGCGSKQADTPAEAAPVENILTVQEPAPDLVTDKTGEIHDLQPEHSPAMPAYDSSMPAVDPSASVNTANEGDTVDSDSTQGLLEPVEVVEESDQNDLFVERGAIDALSEELFLEIINPAEDVAFVESSTFVLRARTIIDAAVSVNDDLVDVNEDGILETVLILEEGPNLIEVVTSVAGGEEKSAVLTIFYLP